MECILLPEGKEYREMFSISKSDTQSIKVGVVHNGQGSDISLQKWWRESPRESWKLGKGFILTSKETQQVIEGLNKALNSL